MIIVRYVIAAVVLWLCRDGGAGVVLAAMESFEVDAALPTVTCRECVQMWRAASKDSKSTCGPNARTCTGNVCFMRQCKHCPVYQYMSGCLTITEWQLADLAISRQRAELQATRVGAVLLCEDSFNQTTCICNRKHKCNDIHAREPFSTYTGNLFGGIINFDAAISRFDPRYSETVHSRQFRYFNGATPRRPLSAVASALTGAAVCCLLNFVLSFVV